MGIAPQELKPSMHNIPSIPLNLESPPLHVGTYTSTPTRYQMPSPSSSLSHGLGFLHFSHVIFYTTYRHYYTNKTIVIAVVRYVYVNIASHFLIYHSATCRHKYTNWTPDVIIVRFILVLCFLLCPISNFVLSISQLRVGSTLTGHHKLCRHCQV